MNTASRGKRYYHTDPSLDRIKLSFPGGSAKESGSFVRSIDGRVAKSGGQPEQRRTRRQNVAEVIGASLAGGKFAKHCCNGRPNGEGRITTCLTYLFACTL